MQPQPVSRVLNLLRRRVCLGLVGGLACAAVTAQAQTFPSKPITLIVPYGAGGPTDVQIRALAAAAAKELGQPIVINNVPGVGGTLGPATMARTAAPNGYTLAVVVGSMFRMPHLQKVDYHPVNDFTYVIGLTGYTFGVAVSADAPGRPWPT
jgi:tripartite-type tricarboxylate transporter receptor subunit TctC